MKRIGVLVLLIVGVVAGCGGGGGGGDDGKVAAFSVSPSSLTFSGQLDGKAPASQTITITPNLSDTVAPDITASGDAIASAPGTCLGLSDSNLVCDWGMDGSLLVTVPVPDPDTLGVGTHHGSIAIVSSQHSVTVSVTYNIVAGPAMVKQITPHPVVAGVAGTATIRGTGFARFAGATPTVMFGSTAATAVTVVNNNTLSVGYPPMAAGSYDVSVSGASEPFTSTAQLVVTAPQTYPAATIGSSGTKNGLVFDATRRALYVSMANTVQRYAYNGSEWSATPVTRSVTGLGAIALSADGAHLVAAADERFVDLDPVTLVQLSSTESTSVYTPSFDSAAMLSSGEVLATSSNQWQYLHAYNANTRAVSTSEEYFEYPDNQLHTARLSGSAQGNRVLIRHGDGVTIYDDTQKSLTSITSTHWFGGSISTDGSVIASTEEVFKDSGSGYVTQATLPDTPDAVLVAPSGGVVYGYIGASHVLRPYDVSVAGNATAGADIALDSNPGNYVIMTISPEGKTVFVAGNDGVVIVPVP